ncbi:LON peptidase substrate-binding domain-containing protein [Jatrophihabitans telluris]|uniref:LON peptidase substrate-binding domain-containing protein n=1 Tax=Jatrophihabitans telluris TaxID=2038343 RepID=A0ABY4QVL4_9ACTN|nr:LON peptidase substrate-binding domain-containing protein [Jatrophihabitans telluris]UQX87172.1 LON peptidase substrate-binding domain-containing protein [Jatrophihabitans telluris]
MEEQLPEPRPESAQPLELLPLFPLGTVLVPGMPLALQVFEPRYRRLMADLLDGVDAEPDDETHPVGASAVFGVVALRRGWEVGAVGDLHEIGTTARISSVRQTPDGRYELEAFGEQRFRIHGLDQGSQPYLLGSVEYLDEPDGPLSDHASVSTRLAWRDHLAALHALTDGAGLDPEGLDEKAVPLIAGRPLSYAIAELPSLPVADRQQLLSCPDTATRLTTARRVLHRETVLVRRLRAIPATAATFSAAISAC